MLNGEDCVMSNGRLIKQTPTNTPNYQIHSSNKSITAQIIQLHQILASASAPSTGQSTHEDLVKESGLRHIFFYKSCLQRILFHINLACGALFSWQILFLIIRGCVSFQVSYSVYQYITSDHEPATCNCAYGILSWYMTLAGSHQKSSRLHGKCFTYSLQILTLQTARCVRAPSSQVDKSCPPNALRPLPRPPTLASQHFWQNKSIQWLLLPSSLLSPTVSYRDCWALMHSAES